MPLDLLEVPEHPLAVLDLVAAQAARIRPVQPRRMGFQPVIV